MAFHLALPFHEGEEKMHSLTKVPVRDNPMNPGLSPRAAMQIQQYPIMALGTTDPNDENRPWTSLWGGEAPISQPIARGGVIGIKTTVDSTFDPVIGALIGKIEGGEAFKQPQAPGPMVSALSIDLETRSRVKLFGRMAVGVLNQNESGDELSTQEDDAIKSGKAGNVQLVVKIEQSLGNCPKYLNKKKITAYPDLKPRLLSEDIILDSRAVDLVQRADMFFISSSHEFEDMDTNHRGGPLGFIRVQQPESSSGVQSTTLVWPEYSGNNLYQTLGNLITTPKAGVTIPDFETGDVLYLSGDAEVLVNQDANAVLSKSKLAVSFVVKRARFVANGLGFRGVPVDDGAAQGRSPYNPRVRYLTSEQSSSILQGKTQEQASLTATLVAKTKLTPTITRYRFSLSTPPSSPDFPFRDSASDQKGHKDGSPSQENPQAWRPGQHVALDFSSELDMGYSHMRDDDPTSLNDDFIRTFTVCSPSGALGRHGEEFELVVRKVGSVTEWLSHQNVGVGMEVGVLGFGGGELDLSVDDSANAANEQPPPLSEKLSQADKIKKKLFIAGGIGITPILAQIRNDEQDRPQSPTSTTAKEPKSSQTKSSNLHLRWTINVQDIGLVDYVLDKLPPSIRSNTIIYLTGDESQIRDEYKDILPRLSSTTTHADPEKGKTVHIERRRMTREDLYSFESIDASTTSAYEYQYYMCAAPEMSKVVSGWLSDMTSFPSSSSSSEMSVSDGTNGEKKEGKKGREVISENFNY